VRCYMTPPAAAPFNIPAHLSTAGTASWWVLTMADTRAFQQSIIEIGRTGHVRRKFVELNTNHSSEIAGQPLPFFGALYAIAWDAAELNAVERH
jgi:hypothetical protein